MKNVQVVVNTVNPSQFAAYAAQFRAEGFTVPVATIDSLTALLPGLTVKANYNRNQQVVAATVTYSEWLAGMTDDFLKTNVLRVLGKPDMTGKIQATPVMTPIDKNGQIVTPPSTTLGKTPLPVKAAAQAAPVKVGPTTATDVHALVEKIKAENAALKTKQAEAPKPATVVPPSVTPVPKTA